MAVSHENVELLLSAKSQIAEIDKAQAKLALLSRAGIDATRANATVARQAKSIIDTIQNTKAAASLKETAAQGARVAQSIKWSSDELRRFEANAKRAREEVRRISSDTNTFAGRIGSQLVAGIKLGFGVDIASRVAGGITSTFAFAKSAAIDFNATIEQQEFAFRTLLGSADAAKQRVAELYTFAKDTPFEFEQIVLASRVLQSLTGGALAAGEGLQIVGDTAAANSRQLEEVSMWIGRVYAGLQSGTPIGEATLRLIEMGVIGGDTARRLNRLAESGAAVGNAMAVIRQEFGRFSGAMAEQSKTLNGQLAILRDTLMMLIATNAKSFFETMKFGVEQLNTVLNTKDIQNYIDLVRVLMDAGTLGPLARGLGAAIGGGSILQGIQAGTPFDGTASGKAPSESFILQTHAMEMQIRSVIKAKRDQGEIDDDEAARLAKKLRLLSEIEDVEQRMARLTDLAATVGRGKALSTAIGAGVAPASPELSDAAKSAQGDVFKKFLESARSTLTERQRLEIEHVDELDRINTVFANNEEARKAALFMVDQIFAQRRLALDEKETQEKEERAAEALKAFIDVQNEMERTQMDRLERELAAEQKQIENRLALMDSIRGQVQGSFLLTSIQKRNLEKKSIETELAMLRDSENEARFLSRFGATAESREMHSRQADLFTSGRQQAEGRLMALNAAGDPEDFSDQFGNAMTNIQNRWGSWAQQMATAFESVFESAISTISNGITGLIMGTMTWEEALSNIGVTILTEIVQSIVQMGVRWVLTQIMINTAANAFQSAALAANAGFAAALSAVWATPATLSTIASYGASAAAAPAQIAISQGMTLAQSLAAFKSGGYTGMGNTSDIAGIVHKDEYVIPSRVLRQYGRDFFDRMMEGATFRNSPSFSGGMSYSAPSMDNIYNVSNSAHPAAKSKNVFNFAAFHGRSEAERYLSTQEGERFMLDFIRRTQHEVAG